jgi:hypothetical protein
MRPSGTALSSGELRGTRATVRSPARAGAPGRADCSVRGPSGPAVSCQRATTDHHSTRGETPFGGALSARVSWTEAAQRGSLAAKAATVETGHRGNQRDLSVTCRRLRVKTLRDGKWSVLQDNRVVTSLDGRRRPLGRGPRPAKATVRRVRRGNSSSPVRAPSVARRSSRGDLARRVGCHFRVILAWRTRCRPKRFRRSDGCAPSVGRHQNFLMRSVKHTRNGLPLDPTKGGTRRVPPFAGLR